MTSSGSHHPVLEEILEDVSLFRVLSAPAGTSGDQDPPFRRAIRAGLLDAGVRDTAVACLWVRPKSNEPLQILISDPRSKSEIDSDGTAKDAAPNRRGVPLQFPLGARGIPVANDQLRALLASIGHWTECRGSFEPLLQDRHHDPGPVSFTALDDVVAYLSHRAFAWLVVARPTSMADTEKERDELRRDLYRLQQSGKQSIADSLEVERKEGWFRELTRAGTGGVWQVSILVGAVDERTANDVAAVLSSAAEHAVTHYRIRPYSPDIEGSPLSEDRDSQLMRERFPFSATVDLVGTLVRPPESELPGVHLQVPPSFDTTAEPGLTDSRRVLLGEILDKFLRPSGSLHVDLPTLNRHTFVCGSTGAGKSQTVRTLLHVLSTAKPPIPWLVIEPAKSEYARMAGRLRGISTVYAITPGDRNAPPASFNPLEPATLEVGNPDRTFPLQSHADLVRALFLAAFRADEPFPQVISKALVMCYQDSGWDLVTGEPLCRWSAQSGQAAADGSVCPRYPSLGDLQRNAWSVVGTIGYDEDTRRRVQGFVDVRVGSLRLGTPGRLFEGGHPLDVASILKSNVVFQIETITNDLDKAFVMGALLIRVYEQLLLEERERFASEQSPAVLRHLTVVEEAHRLLRNVVSESPAAHSLELFASLLAEVRAYGEGVVVAEQIPSKLIPDVIKNSALKVVHRLPSADDRSFVGATINLSEAQSQYVVTLEPGVAAIFTDGMDRPILALMNSKEEQESEQGVERTPPMIEGRRCSRACGSECRDVRPCTLQEMRVAELLLDQHPVLAVWAEIACGSHVVGLHSPGIEVSHQVLNLRKALLDEPRLVQCAVMRAIEDAIAARYDGLRLFYDPDAFGEHLAQSALAALRGKGIGEACADDYGIWRAGRRRFMDIEEWLRASIRHEDTPKPHSSIVDTARRRGVDLISDDPASNLSYLQSLPWKRVSSALQHHLMVGNVEAPKLREAGARLFGIGVSDNELSGKVFGALRWGSDKQSLDLQAIMWPVVEDGSEKTRDHG